MRRKMILLMVGGALGTLARFYVGSWIGSHAWARGFPYGTLLINVSGSFILALVGVIFLERMTPINENWYLLIGTGFCGAYTTFSTFEWETYKLIRDGSKWLAAANVLGSVTAGFVGVLLGVWLASRIYPRE